MSLLLNFSSDFFSDPQGISYNWKLFNLQIFGNITAIFLCLISSLISLCSENILGMTFYSFIYVCFPKTCSALVLSHVCVTGMCGVLCSGWMSFRYQVDWQCCLVSCVLLIFHALHASPGRGRGSLCLSPCICLRPLDLSVFALCLLVPLLVHYSCMIIMSPI